MIIKILLCILAILVIIALALLFMLTGNVKNIKRVDDEGYLYSMDYTGNYRHNPLSALPVCLLSGVGCSTFLTHSIDGDVLTGRNYDFPHKDNAGNITGLNVIINFAPRNRYRSLCIADAAFFTVIGIPYYKGTLDSGKVRLFPLTFIPYLCMDGINEKGLTASILSLDIKKGEKSVRQNVDGKKKVNITRLLRYILDNCADVKEAIELAGKYNMVDSRGNDYHMFLTDDTGASVVLEWRYNEMQVVETDIATNFYVGFDDGEDSLRKDGTVREFFERPPEIPKRYHYGYGHGYDRFTIVAKAMMWSVAIEAPYYYTHMYDDKAMDLLCECGQDFDEENPTSCTQYSAVYNNTRRSVEICVMRNYKKTYRVALKQ